MNSLTLPYDLVVLSPHLDDAVLSCGAQLNALTSNGGRALAVTFFTADVPPPPRTQFTDQVFHYMDLDLDSGMAVRRGEDIAACQELGIDWQHLPLSEAICRRINDTSEPFPYDSSAKLFGTPHPDDAASLSIELAPILNTLPPAKRWLAPLGIGGHVDHRLLRQAAMQHVAHRPGPKTPELLFYEDFPYALKLKNRFRALGLAAFGFANRRFQPHPVAVSGDSLEKKIKAIAHYTSQVRPLFGTHQDLSRTVHGYAAKVGGERLWKSMG